MINPDIEQRAEALLARHGVNRAPVPVEQIAQAEQVQVVRSPAAGQESGFLMRDGRRILIGLNTNEHPRRQRFTIAHELGHLQLHKGRPLIVDHAVRINNRNQTSSAASDNEEMEANAFAAALLMPSALVEAAVWREQELGINTREQLTDNLAAEFDVSKEAMSWRLINLGVFS